MERSADFEEMASQPESLTHPLMPGVRWAGLDGEVRWASAESGTLVFCGDLRANGRDYVLLSSGPRLAVRPCTLKHFRDVLIIATNITERRIR